MSKESMVIRIPGKHIYLSSSDSDTDVRLSRFWLQRLEREYSCIYRPRDGEPGILRHENARHLIPKCHMVVSIVTQAYTEDDWCLYEIALAIDFARDVILLRYNNAELPSIFKNLQLIDSDQEHLERVMMFQIKRHMKTDLRPSVIQYDLLKEFLWNIERKLLSDVQGAMALQTTTLMSEITYLRKRIHELIQLRLQESSELLSSNNRLKVELIRKMDHLCKENHFSVKYVLHLTKEHIEHRQIIEQLQIQNKALQSKLEETIITSPSSHSPEQQQKINTNEAVDVLYKIIPEMCHYHRSSQTSEIDNVRLTRMPSQIRAFCQRYHELLGFEEIQSLGHFLGLSCDCLDRINYYTRYGTSEAFWQLIREYIRTKNGEVSVASLVDAFTIIGIKLEGKPMAIRHRTVLDNNVAYIYENIQDIIIILPAIMKKEYMSTAKAGYILNSASKLQSLLRFVEFLKSKEDGLHRLCEALHETGQLDLAKNLRRKFELIPHHSGSSRQPTESNDEKDCVYV